MHSEIKYLLKLHDFIVFGDAAPSVLIVSGRSETFLDFIYIDVGELHGLLGYICVAGQ